MALRARVYMPTGPDLPRCSLTYTDSDLGPPRQPCNCDLFSLRAALKAPRGVAGRGESLTRAQKSEAKPFYPLTKKKKISRPL